MKNKADFNDLMISDYYKEQDFAFLIFITGQIHQKIIAAVKKLDNNAISIHDILLMARRMNAFCATSGRCLIDCFMFNHDIVMLRYPLQDRVR